MKMTTTIAALIAGVTAGLICGVLMQMLRSRSQIEELESQLSSSIPKRRVIQAINRNHMNSKAAHQKRKDNSNAYWEGALQAVWNDLEEDLR